MSSPYEIRFQQFRNPYHAKARAAAEPFLKALSYRPRVQVVPDRAGASVAPLGKYEGRVTLPVGSVLWAIAATSEQAAGFQLNILDGRDGDPLASEKAFFNKLAGATTTTQVRDCAGTLKTIAQPLFVLPQYRIMTEPGLLRVQISNLAPTANRIQVALHVALPPRPGDPRNAWNDLLDAELSQARNAIKNIDLTTGQALTITTTTALDPMSQPATTLPFNVSTVGDNIIIPAAAGYRIAVQQLALFSTAVQTIRFLQGEGAGATDLSGPLTDYAGGFGLAYQKEEPHFVLATEKSFTLNIAAGSGGASGALSGFIKFRMLQQWGV